MVILFKGTDKSKNYAPQALALCAGLSATKFLKKTLILQITTKYPIEGYVIGKKIGDQAIQDTMNLFEDTGMDSLTRRAGVTAFNADHFANAVTPVVSSENLFDILEVSKKVEADVEREIIQDPTVIGTIIKSAKRIYDNIFILANGKSVKVIESILPYVDKTVTCVRQGLKEDVSAPAADKEYFLVTDYDYKSTYSERHMTKIYGNKKTFIMPYNVEFKDYYTDKNMLQYILHNTEPEKSDYSYHLISNMTKLTQVLIEDEYYENDDYRFTYRTFERSIQDPIELYGSNAYIETTKKSFLKPSKKLVHVSTTDDILPDSEDIFDDEDIEPVDTNATDISKNHAKAKKAQEKKLAKEAKAMEKKQAKEAKAKAKRDAAIAKKKAKREVVRKEA